MRRPRQRPCAVKLNVKPPSSACALAFVSAQLSMIGKSGWRFRRVDRYSGRNRDCSHLFGGGVEADGIDEGIKAIDDALLEAIELRWF